MQGNTDSRRQRRRQAIVSASVSSGWLLLSAAVIMLLRARFVPSGIGSVIMAAAAAFEVLMLIPLAFSLKSRLQEIQGGEEDEARNY